MVFQEKLVILRKTRGLTQDEFASAVGVSRQAVYKWESGQSYPEVQKLLEIKTLFNISIDNLLDDSYNIPLPEKKKRKRISKETKEKIEKSVESSEVVAEAPVAPKAEAAPTPKAEVKEEAAAPVEEVIVPKVEASIPKHESFNIVVNEEKEEEKEEAFDEKKTGFFGRFFSRK